MTSPQPTLRSASSDDRGALLRALEFVARGRVQPAQIVGAVVGQSMSLESGPQVFDGVHVRRVWRKEYDLDLSAQAERLNACHDS